MIILGAGMAGLLAGNMLRRLQPEIYEAQSELPNNHSALLRFRTPAVSDATAVPFKKVRVIKGIRHEAYNQDALVQQADIRLSNMYAQKVTGKIMNRSIMNLEPSERYIAPLDFLSQCARGLQIYYDRKISSIENINAMASPIISTLPMNVMMDIAGYKNKPTFNFLPIWSLSATIALPDVDVYQTVYYPGFSRDYYRASVTGNTLIVEFINQIGSAQGTAEFLQDILERDFGIAARRLSNINLKHQKYGKLLPIDEKIRKHFILWLTNEHGIYSLGRFATWRQILLDDVVNDVKVIEGFLQQTDYERTMHWRQA